MKIKIRKIEYSDIYILFLVYLFASLWFFQYSAGLRAVIAIIIPFILIGLKKRTQKIVITKRTYSFVIVMISCIILSILVNKSLTTDDIYTILCWIIAIIVVSTIDYKKYCKSYICIWSILSFFSIITYILMIFYPAIFENFPEISKQTWLPSPYPKNLIISIVQIYSHYKRNYGICYEPGLFAFYINLSLYLMLFVLEKYDRKCLLVLSIALGTTKSTNGYITYVLLVLAFILKTHLNKESELSLDKNIGLLRKRKQKIVIIIIFIVFIGIVFFAVNKDSWEFLINKLSEFNSSSKDGSGFKRFAAMNSSINAIKQNPITGWTSGRLNTIYKGNIHTFTPLEWYALYGVFYGSLCNFWLLKGPWIDIKQILVSLTLTLALFTMTVSQNLTYNVFLLSLIIYNFNRSRMKIER